MEANGWWTTKADTHIIHSFSCNEEGSKVDALVPSPAALIGPA